MNVEPHTDREKKLAASCASAVASSAGSTAWEAAFVSTVKIKAIVLIIRSKRDASGNTYWAFRVTSTETGKNAEGLADHESNILRTARELFGAMGYYWTQKELPKRLFNDECGSWKYAGCKSDEMAKFITSNLAN